MIDVKEVIVKNVIFHRYCNDNAKCVTSDSAYEYKNEEEEDVLKKIFLKPFQSSIVAQEFVHSINLNLNPLYKISQDIYNGENFIEKTKDIFQHLKTTSKHPNIKDGDVFVLKYEDIKIDNAFYEAIGIYKIENQESFIEPIQDLYGKSTLSFKKGIGARKLDKACLIVFTKKPYTIYVIDNGSKDTEYWKDDFINAISKDDSTNNTDNFLTLTRSFIENKLSRKQNISKIEATDILNKSLMFFKQNNSFDMEMFTNEVIKDTNIVKEFKEFKESYQKGNNIKINDQFNIASQAVKKQSNKFKPLIKLDKNFDIHIHANSELIEKGIDADGRKYYKIYYNEEN